jgi:hypothetical protein
MREGKRGTIPVDSQSVHERLQIDPRYWLYMAEHIESRFKGLVSTACKVKAVTESLVTNEHPALPSV